MLAASPKGTVPVLVLPDGRVIDESLDIMRWALAQADPENWLADDDPILLATNDGPFKRHLDRYKYADPDDRHAHRDAAVALLSGLEDRLSDRRTLTGMALLPFVRQFAHVDRDAFATLPLPRVRRWLEHHLASPLFDSVMARPASARPTGR